MSGRPKAVIGPNRWTDMDLMAFVLALADDLAFWGNKTMKTFSGRRLVFNEFGELVRIQELIDGSWLTVARADESNAED